MANPLAASTPQLSSPGGMGLPHSPGCCEVGQPVFADPRTGHPVCACQLGGSLMPGAPRVPGPADLPYGMPPTLQGPPGSFPGGEPAFYASMGNAYGLKDSPEVFQGISHLGGYYPYDPTMIYPYMNGFGGLDARRKNATKESTNTLKAWLYEHRKNPYPTKGEKIMLAILTKMTLTQVSTWFANARRRLKKENKVGWSSKDDDDTDDKEEDRTGSDDEDIGRAHNDRSLDDDGAISDMSEPLEPHGSDHKEEDVDVDGDDEDEDFHKISSLPLLAHRQQATSSSSNSSNAAIVPITPPPSPRGHHLTSASMDRFRLSAVPSSSRVDIVTSSMPSVPCTRTVAPNVNRETKQNSAPKPKIWSVDDMMSKKEPSSSSSPTSPASIRPSPTSATHAPYLPPQFYPGFNGLSSAENGMSLAMAYSRGLAAAGSAGLQVYSMAPAYHPGMEGAQHQMTLAQHSGGRPIDSYKHSPTHTVAVSGAASTENKGNSHRPISLPAEVRRVSEASRNGMGTTAFRPVVQRR